MSKGRVKWFNNAKGYGFILPTQESNGEDLFVHYSAINMDGYKTLKAGQVVSYDMVQGPKGLHAVNISSVQNHDVLIALSTNDQYGEVQTSYDVKIEKAL